MYSIPHAIPYALAPHLPRYRQIIPLPTRQGHRRRTHVLGADDALLANAHTATKALGADTAHDAHAHGHGHGQEEAYPIGRRCGAAGSSASGTPRSAHGLPAAVGSPSTWPAAD